MKPIFAAFLLSFFASSLFGQATNEVVFSFDHRVGAEPLVLGQTQFSIWNNKKMILTRAEFYISEAAIMRPDSSMADLTDQYLLVSALAPTAEFDLGPWPIDAAIGATLHIGVPFAANHLDPASFPADHPLAPKNPAMNWGWSGGYRFLVVEGKIDNNGDGVPESVFEWHNVGDALYKTVPIGGAATAADGKMHLHFVIDYAQLFKNMAMTGNLTQHGGASANVKMMNNAEKEHFLIMPVVSAAPEIAANSAKIAVSPNPFSVETRLDWAFKSAADGLTLIVTDALGRTVRTVAGLTASGSIRLEKGALASGVFQCVFYEKGQPIAQKQIVIE